MLQYLLYHADSGLLTGLEFSHRFGESCVFGTFFKVLWGGYICYLLLFAHIFMELFYFLSHQFAQQITGMRFCEASAKDNFNVDEIFLKLVDDILKKVKYSGGSIPLVTQMANV